MKLLIKILVFIFPIILLISCLDNPINNPNEIVFPETGVTYTQHVEPLLRFSCNAPGCHNSIDRQGNIILDSYEQLLMAYTGAMIRSGDPENSLLIKIITRQVMHSVLVDFRVNQNQIEGLKRWIKNGTPR